MMVVPSVVVVVAPSSAVSVVVPPQPTAPNNIFSLCHLTILNSQGFQSMKQTNDIRLLKNILIANYKYENQNSILLSNYLELENYTISYTVDDMGDYFLIETRLKNDRYKLNITFYL